MFTLLKRTVFILLLCITFAFESQVTRDFSMYLNLGPGSNGINNCSKWIYIVSFYVPGLKGPPGASSVWIVCPSVCRSVCRSVRNSVPLINKVQYLKFGWSYSNQTWIVSSSKGCSHFTDITCPWGLGGVKM